MALPRRGELRSRDRSEWEVDHSRPGGAATGNGVWTVRPYMRSTGSYRELSDYAEAARAPGRGFPLPCEIS